MFGICWCCCCCRRRRRRRHCRCRHWSSFAVYICRAHLLIAEKNVVQYIFLKIERNSSKFGTAYKINRRKQRAKFLMFLFFSPRLTRRRSIFVSFVRVRTCWNQKEKKIHSDFRWCSGCFVVFFLSFLFIV